MKTPAYFSRTFQTFTAEDKCVRTFWLDAFVMGEFPTTSGGHSVPTNTSIYAPGLQ
jgi:hypothetical protein